MGELDVGSSDDLYRFYDTVSLILEALLNVL